MFYIYGEVTRAGAYQVEPNMTVMQAIAARRRHHARAAATGG